MSEEKVKITPRVLVIAGIRLIAGLTLGVGPAIAFFYFANQASKEYPPATWFAKNVFYGDPVALMIAGLAVLILFPGLGGFIISGE